MQERRSASDQNSLYLGYLVSTIISKLTLPFTNFYWTPAQNREDFRFFIEIGVPQMNGKYRLCGFIKYHPLKSPYLPPSSPAKGFGLVKDLMTKIAISLPRMTLFQKRKAIANGSMNWIKVRQGIGYSALGYI